MTRIQSYIVRYNEVKATNRDLCFAHTFVQYNYRRFGNFHIKSNSRKKIVFSQFNRFANYFNTKIFPIYGSVHVSQ